MHLTKVGCFIYLPLSVITLKICYHNAYMIQRRKLSAVGLRWQRVGRKAIAASRMSASIEGSAQKTNQARRIKLPSIHYTFRKWHAGALAGVAVITIAGVFGFNVFQNQQRAAAQTAKAAAEQAAVEKQKVQQACLADVTAKKQDQLGKVTYDQLYDGLCQ